MITLLLIEGYLKEDFHFTPYAVISYIEPGLRSMAVLADQVPVKLVLPSYLGNKISKLFSSSQSTATKTERKGKKLPLKRTLTTDDKKVESMPSKKKGVTFCDESDNSDVEVIEDGVIVETID